MINTFYESILLNLDKFNSQQTVEISQIELNKIKKEFYRVHQATKGYVEVAKRKLNAYIKDAKYENININIITKYEDKLKSLEEIESTLDRKDTLELFVNIDSFLTSVVDNPQMLKEVNIQEYYNNFKNIIIIRIFF